MSGYERAINWNTSGKTVTEVRQAERIATLEQQVAALTKERDDALLQIEHRARVSADKRALQIIDGLKISLAATQAREAKLRETLIELSGNHITMNSRAAIDKALALPADDTALQARLKEERERCKKECEGFTHRDDKEVAEAIAVAIGSMT